MSLATYLIFLSTFLANDSQTVVLIMERAPGSALLIGLLGLDICSAKLMPSIGLVQASLAAVVVAAFAKVEADD